MKKKICPICGKGVLERVTKLEKIEDRFAGASEVEEVEYLCPVCGERGDFFDENSKTLEKAYKEQKRVATANILDFFIDKGMNFAAIERSLEIPQRTLAKWKGQYTEPSAAAVALLKYLYTFPWLLEVADTNFDPKNTEKILCKEYVYSLGKAMSSSGIQCFASAFKETDASIVITMKMVKEYHGSQQPVEEVCEANNTSTTTSVFFGQEAI